MLKQTHKMTMLDYKNFISCIGDHSVSDWCHLTHFIFPNGYGVDDEFKGSHEYHLGGYEEKFNKFYECVWDAILSGELPAYTKRGGREDLTPERAKELKDSVADEYYWSEWGFLEKVYISSEVFSEWIADNACYEYKNALHIKWLYAYHHFHKHLLSPDLFESMAKVDVVALPKVILALNGYDLSYEYSTCVDCINKDSEMSLLYEAAQQAIHIGKLNVFDFSTPEKEEAVDVYNRDPEVSSVTKIVKRPAKEDLRVSMKEFKTWAKSQGFVFSAHQNTSVRKKSEQKDLNHLERKSLLTMVYAMAVQKYRHDPSKSKNSSISNIQRSIEECGLSLNEKTIRTWLKEASELFE